MTIFTEGLVTFFLSTVISLALQFCTSTEPFHFKGEKKRRISMHIHLQLITYIYICMYGIIFTVNFEKVLKCLKVERNIECLKMLTFNLSSIL